MKLSRPINPRNQHSIVFRPSSSKLKPNQQDSFLSKTDSDPQSPYCYIQAHKQKFDPLEKIIVTPETFSHYKELASSNLKSGNPDMALTLYRECFHTLIEIHGMDSQHYEAFFIDTMKALCNHAMKNLTRNNMYSCFNLLFECNEMTQPNGGDLNFKYFPQLHAIVLNNLGCAYKRINKNRKSYQYLKEALSVIFKYKVECLIGLTYVNLCSIASQMGFHTKALYFAKNSLIYTQNDLLNLTSQKNYEPSNFKEKVHLVAVSFYNLAVEEEFQHDYDKALDWYKKAYLFIEEKLGPDESSIKKFKLAYEKTKEKLIDKVLNQESNQLPRFPVNQTLRKFYKKSANNETIGQKDGKLYMKNRKLNSNISSSPQSNSFYYNGKKASRPGSTKTKNSFIQSKTRTSPMMFGFSENQEEIMNLKINNFIPEIEDKTFNKEFDEILSNQMKTQNVMNYIEKTPKNRDFEDFEILNKKNNKKNRDFEDCEAQNNKKNSKEIELLEKSGILNWDGSETSSFLDNEEDFEKTISQKRTLFLNNLNSYENELETKKNFYPSAENRHEKPQKNLEETPKKPRKNAQKEDFLDIETDQSHDQIMEKTKEVKKSSEKEKPLDFAEIVFQAEKKTHEIETIKTKLLNSEEEESKNKEINKNTLISSERKRTISSSSSNKNFEQEKPIIKSEKKPILLPSEKPDLLDFNANKSKSPYKDKRNMSLKAQSHRSLSREIDHIRPDIESEYLPSEKNPIITKIFIKIKDIDIQTDDDPIIRPEHLLENSKDFSQIIDDNNEKKEKELILNRKNMRKIVKLQRFYKERYRQKKLFEYRKQIEDKSRIIFIQKAFKVFLKKRRFEALRVHYRSDRLLMKRKIIKLKAQSSFLDYDSFFLNVFLIKSTKVLNWILFDFYSKKILEIFSEIFSIIDHDAPIDNPDNLQRISNKIEKDLQLLDMKEGFLEFKPKTAENQEIEKNEDFELHTSINYEHKKKSIRIDLRKLQIVQRKIRQSKYQDYLIERMNKKYKVLAVFHKKLTENAYLRLNYCITLAEKPTRYMAGAILADCTYKLNVVILENSLLRLYNNKVNASNIFDIISIDLNKKTMNLTEEAQFKSELEDKLQILKTLETKTNFDQQKIIKIQTIIKGIKARRLYELRKSNAKLKKNAIILHRKFLNKEKGEIDRYLLVISYIKHENLLISRVIDIKNHEAKTLEIKKKLYEFFNINELRNFADIMATRASIVQNEQKQSKFIIPPIEKLINERHHDSTSDHKSLDKDPYLEAKFKFSKEFIKNCLENDRKLNIFSQFEENCFENIEDSQSSEIKSLRKIQKFYRLRNFQRKTELCLSKRVRRCDIANFEKFFNIKEIALFEDNPIRKKNKNGLLEEEKKRIKEKKKKSQDPYKKEIIIIRKFFHIFNGIEPAKLKAYYHIYFHTIIIDIKYKNFNKTQQLTNPLSFFNMIDFNKALFIRNFDILILQNLRYSEHEKTVYFIKPDLPIEPEKPMKSIIKTGNSLSKIIDKADLNPEQRLLFEKMLRSNEGNSKSSLFLDKIHQKLYNDYYSIELFVNIEYNLVRFHAKKTDDPDQKIEKTLFLPDLAQEFLENHKENHAKIKAIFSHFLKNVRNRIDWQEKSLRNEKMEAEFRDVLKKEDAILKIQNAFRSSKQKRQLEFMKISWKKSKLMVLRKFYKINGNYADIFFFLYQNEPILEIKAMNMNHKRKNVKIYKLNLMNYMNKMKLEVKSKENMILLIHQLIKSMSIKIVNESVFILSNNEDLYLEEIDSYIESDRDYERRFKNRKGSLLGVFSFHNESQINHNMNELTHKRNDNKNIKANRITAANLIQNRMRIMKLREKKEFNKMLLNAKTIYLLTIIEKVQGNYILAYFYYLKSFDEIMINLVNLNQTKKILKSYTIDIQSISQELYSMLNKTKNSIERQRPAHYQKVFSNLLKFLWKKIQISCNYEKLTAISLDKSLRLLDVSELKKKKKDMEDLEDKNREETKLNFALKIQRNFRKNRTKFLFSLLKDSERKRLDELKRYGKKIKHKIKIFNEIPYYIFVFIKSDQTLTFLAIRKEKNSLKITRSYQLDNLKLINTNGMDFVDFLVANLKIYDEQIVFDIENLVALEPENIQITNSNNNELMISSPLVAKNNLMGLLKSNGEVEFHEEISKKIDEFFKPVIEVPESNPKIIHQKREDINENQLCVFNVYYQKAKGRVISTDDSNHIQIEIDLKDIKKFNPMLDFSDKYALKNFAEQLTQCIKVNELGEILIDSNKITPQCLHLTKKPIQSQLNMKADPLKQLKKFDKRQLLAKGVKFAGSKKYFLLANYIERPIQSLKGQISKSDNEVFEDYESLIEIVATSISNEGSKIQWEMAEQDAFLLANSSNVKETAKILIDKIQIIGLKGDKFLFGLSEIVSKKFSQVALKEEYKNVVFLQEKALKILQNNVKSRRFSQNYKKYKKEIEKKQVISKSTFKLGKEKLLIFLIENKPILEILLWDLRMFNRLEVDVKIEHYEGFLMNKKTRAGVLPIMKKFISIYNKNVNFDEKTCLETLKKHEILEINKE